MTSGLHSSLFIINHSLFILIQQAFGGCQILERNEDGKKDSLYAKNVFVSLKYGFKIRSDCGLPMTAVKEILIQPSSDLKGRFIS